MTAHRNNESSHPCSENISILPLKFSRKICYFIPQIEWPRKAQSFPCLLWDKEGGWWKHPAGQAMSARGTPRALAVTPLCQEHCSTAETLPTHQKLQEELYFSFLISTATSESHTTCSPIPKALLNCSIPYRPRCCKYKTHPILSSLESFLPNPFSQKAQRMNFLWGGERSRQQTTQASTWGSLGVCLKQSQNSNKIPAFPSPCSQPTGRVSLPNVEVLSFIEVHSFLTFADRKSVV